MKGKCTTDHISPGGKWLPYRGNIDRISDNLLERGINAFNGQAGKVWNTETKAYDTPAKVARYYKNHHVASVIVGDDNYGEGSSREHAAMEPRYSTLPSCSPRALPAFTNPTSRSRAFSR
ncbi:MAG: hypothetical protein ACLT49_08160 [Sutterella wadsworthensis]